MAIITKKFSEFVQGDLNNINKYVGLSGGANAIFSAITTWTTETRPIEPANGLLGYNLTLQQYEFFDEVAHEWTQLEDSGDISNLITRLASHDTGDGASMIGLENQGSVIDKTVQDLAEAEFIVKTNNGSLLNAQAMSVLSTGIVKNTTGTGVQSISAPVTQIDELTLSANQILYLNALSAYALTPLTPYMRTLLDDADATTAANTLAVLPLLGGTMLGALDMGNFNITNLATPISAQDAVTKNYVDSLIVNIEPPCDVSTTANLTGYSYSNGTSGVGATLTAGSNGAFSADSYSPSLNDRVLVPFQSSSVENGVYTLTQVGDASNPAILTRATDYDTPAKINPGDRFTILNGTLYAGSEFIETATVTTIGTDPITFVQTSNSSYLLKSANLSDVASASTARANLGLNTAATKEASNTGWNYVSSANTPTTTGQFSIFSDTVGSLTNSGFTQNDFLWTANNLSELTATASTARANISAAQSGNNSDIQDLTGLNGTVGTVYYLLFGDQAVTYPPAVAGNYSTMGAIDLTASNYKEFIRFTSNATPTCNLDDSVTKNNLNIYRGVNLNTNGVMYGTSTLGVASTSAGTTGTVLIGTTSSAPSFSNSLNGNFTYTSSTAGVNRTLTVQSTTDTASSAATINVLVEGGVASDPTYQCGINISQRYVWGLDNSDSNAWVLAGGTTLGTNNMVRINTSGVMTKPLQPAFQAYNNTLRSNVTGASAVYTIPFDAEVFDQSGSFNTTTGTFTAPANGSYWLCANLLLSNITAAMTGILFKIVTSNREYQIIATTGNARDNNNNLIINGSVLADMDLNDTATVVIIAANGAGNTCSINASGYTKFMGFLAV